MSDSSFQGTGRVFSTVRAWFASGLGSIVIHIVVLAALFFLMQRHTRLGAAKSDRQTDEIGLVALESRDSMESELPEALSELNNAEANSSSDSSASEQVDINASVHEFAESLLPNAEIGLNSSSTTYGSTEGVTVYGERGGSSSGDGQRVGFGGASGTGRRFVYVLDHSDSMGWKGGAPFRTAQREAIASVESLEPKNGAQKFQLIVYNQDYLSFNGGSALVDASLANKAQAARFLASLTPSGGTSPEPALEKALQMKPDVIFFLTDADEELSEQTLANIQKLRRLYKVKQISVIEYGRSSDKAKKTYKRLAGENGGVYVFRDIDQM
ncbi:MAG: VWA domain-containing protein [Planctomycetia bacterium]|nr:VWA domain-containing protein [Planctomycetia bacterium]